MVKIKTFEFQVSDTYGTKNALFGAWTEKAENKNRDSLSGVNEIDKVVNNFIADKKNVISITSDFVTIHQHNNGGADVVIRYVTITYME